MYLHPDAKYLLVMAGHEENKRPSHLGLVKRREGENSS